MSTMTRILAIRFLDYWQAGSGQSGGGVVDSVALKDHAGLPVLPGRHLKGLLRQSAVSAEAWGWFDHLRPAPDVNLAQWLFGSEAQMESDGDSLGREKTQPGMVRVASAVLPDDERHWLAHKDNSAAVGHLYRELFTTAISLDTGAAKRHSLRGLEVCVPLTLQARVDIAPAPGHQDYARQASWLAEGKAWELLGKSVALIENLGAWRTRGLGRAELSWIKPETGRAGV